MKIRQQKALTFDDVLLVPAHSQVRSRRDVSTSTILVPGMPLHIPVISSNMDTVTESEMAIAMAHAGGIGIIHRFMTVSRMVQEVQRVKRAENLVIDNPLTIEADAPVERARWLMQEQDVGGLLILDDEGRLQGILTARDVLFEDDPQCPVSRVMTTDVITAPEGTSVEEARLICHRARIEKLPLVDEAGRVAGLITTKDIVKRALHPNATKDSKGRLRVGAAIGVKAGEQDRAAAVVEAGVDVLVLDIAHGHSTNALEMMRFLKSEFAGVPLVAGNVASGDGTRALIDAGADAVKVGVGPGSICITRVVTGFGVPQVTAIMDAYEVAHRAGVPVIADGGIRASGDITKALAAGAHTVMIGSLFAGTRESPGRVIQKRGRRYKITRGMASLGATMGRSDQEEQQDWNAVVPEGVEAMVPYLGSIDTLLTQLVGGLRSGLSYAGATTIEELHERAEFIEISLAGLAESRPHDIELM
jgi:IMP dehydrogenase